MLVKGVLCICIQAVLYKAVFTQCIGSPVYPEETLLPANMQLVEGNNEVPLAPVTPIFGRVVGGNIIVDTSAPYAPTGPAGVSIFSDNLLIEGNILVKGNMPFLGTVFLEGLVPTTGISAVSYECGSGNTGIVEDGFAAPITGSALPARLGLPEDLAGCNNIIR